MPLNSELAKLQQYKAVRTAAERAQGIRPQRARFSAQRAAAISITQIDHMPTNPEDVRIQNPDGSFKFLLGYSVTGGPDTLG